MLCMVNQRVYLSQQFHDAVNNFRWLASDLSALPTQIREVVPEKPTKIGIVDAFGRGMGGVWLPGIGALYNAALNPATLGPIRDYQRGQTVADAAATQATRLRRKVAGPVARGDHAWRPILWRHKFL